LCAKHNIEIHIFMIFILIINCKIVINIQATSQVVRTFIKLIPCILVYTNLNGKTNIGWINGVQDFNNPRHCPY
jgi:hypothetical protein